MKKLLLCAMFSALCFGNSALADDRTNYTQYQQMFGTDFSIRATPAYGSIEGLYKIVDTIKDQPNFENIENEKIDIVNNGKIETKSLKDVLSRVKHSIEEIKDILEVLATNKDQKDFTKQMNHLNLADKTVKSHIQIFETDLKALAQNEHFAKEFLPQLKDPFATALSEVTKLRNETPQNMQSTLDPLHSILTNACNILGIQPKEDMEKVNQQTTKLLSEIYQQNQALEQKNKELENQLKASNEKINELEKLQPTITPQVITNEPAAQTVPVVQPVVQESAAQTVPVVAETTPAQSNIPQSTSRIEELRQKILQRKNSL